MEEVEFETSVLRFLQGSLGISKKLSSFKSRSLSKFESDIKAVRVYSLFIFGQPAKDFFLPQAEDEKGSTLALTEAKQESSGLHKMGEGGLGRRAALELWRLMEESWWIFSWLCIAHVYHLSSFIMSRGICKACVRFASEKVLTEDQFEKTNQSIRKLVNSVIE
ncbi:hypothetical protein LguiA_005459 [Lonicera macranthoides]